MNFGLGFTANNVLIGASLLGIAGGVLGSFALLRRESLLGDALAHAALPGVGLAFLLTGSKSPGVLFAGALIAGLIGAFVILAITRTSRVKEDTAIGIVLSVFFGGGIVLLTIIQKMPLGNQTGLDKFLFGQAATLLPRDLKVMGALVAVVLTLTFIFYKELKLLCFDRDYLQSLGFPIRRLEFLLTTLLVTVVVVGLQTVGVVLVVATLITPAAAARQWTERLGIMLFLSASIGGASGAAGALWSATAASMPTGPVIVLCSSAALVISIFLGARRGILWSLLSQRRVTRRIRQENMLKDLYRWGERHGGNWKKAVPIILLKGIRGHGTSESMRVAKPLERRGLLERAERGIRLTQDGLSEAASIVRKHRLWETYLSRRLDLPSDHLHRDADLMEHALDDEAVALLEERLGYPDTDPHGQPIPPRGVA